MRLHHESILARANDTLDVPDARSGRAGQVEAFKRFLKLEGERLRIRHRCGLGGRDVAQGRSYLVDLVVTRACRLAAAELGPAAQAELSRCAVVALGGYGRRELAPCSDVDLLFLYPGRPLAEVQEFVEQALLLLWDVGLTVGHSFRTVGECVAMARSDLHSRNAMAEARLVAGDTALFGQLQRELDAAVYRNDRAQPGYFEAMRRELAERYAKFGRTVCVQEPNVKESAGGLRDLHAALWVGHARYGCNTLECLRNQGWIGKADYAQARRAYDFVSWVRNEAHFATARAADLLTLDLQPALAEALGYEARRGMVASEIFMREYYRRAHQLHRFSQGFLLRAGLLEQPAPRFRLRTRRLGPGGAYEAREGRLYLRTPRKQIAPQQILEALAVAQKEGLELSESLAQAVQDSLHGVDRGFRASAEACRGFIEILRQPKRVGAALRRMHETGFLGRWLPEWSRVTFLVQHDHYHKYTVDEHTLAALDALDELAAGGEAEAAGDGFHRVFGQVADTGLLYLGILLHDIGKGHGGGHVARGTRIAERICARLGLGARADEVVFLVRAHLVMSQLSQRRDINEAGLVEGFVRQVGTLDRLNMLLLLTYADNRGVGPGIWNDWKKSLLWELYLRARSHFSGAAPRRDGDDAARLRQQVIDGLRGEHPASQVERHLALLPPRYLRATDAAAAIRHFRLAAGLGDRALVADWKLVAQRRHTELTVCTRDSHGLLAALAGVLTAQGANILSVDAYTREDGLVLDSFRLSLASALEPIPPERWSRIEEALRRAVVGSLDVAAAVESWREKAPRRLRRRAALRPSVRFDPEGSAASTVIEVHAEDEPGLVYKIARALAALGLDITVAKIATEKSHALDVFYVTDAQGEKLDHTRLPEVETALLRAIDGKPRSHSMEEAG